MSADAWVDLAVRIVWRAGRDLHVYGGIGPERARSLVRKRTYSNARDACEVALQGGYATPGEELAAFFESLGLRRLHESKYPHLSIDYEVVLCMRKL